MYAVAVVMVARARTCTCNCQLRCGSAFLDVRITVRVAFNVYKAVTFVLINVFRCGKKYVVGIGE